MADITMCVSSTCEARKNCTRNAACIGSPRPGQFQYYASFQEEKGYNCEFFQDVRLEKPMTKSVMKRLEAQRK